MSIYKTKKQQKGVYPPSDIFVRFDFKFTVVFVTLYIQAVVFY